MAAVMMAAIMLSFGCLMSHITGREKIVNRLALMNFFANCNQARPSQLAGLMRLTRLG